MKLAIISLIAVTGVLTQDYYDPKFDGIDIGSIIKDEAVVKKFTYCFEDKEPCDELSKQIKELIPEVFATACAKCSPAQKKIAKLALDMLEHIDPEDKAHLLAKFDPENKYLAGLQAAVADA